MIIRFLNRNGKVCEISSTDTPMLVYSNKKEKDSIINLVDGECFTLIDSKQFDVKKTQEVLFKETKPLTLT